MPNYTVQLRRGTAAEHSSFTGAAGEITVNTTRNSVHVHDGSTAGGTELATKASVDNLSSNSIIDADSDTHVKVESTSDADTIDFTVAGTTIAKMESTGLIPTINSNGTTGYDLGSASFQWRDVYVSSGSLYVNGSQVLQDDAGTILVSADADQSLTVKTTGTGESTMQSAAGVNLTATGSADITLTTSTGQVEINGDIIFNAANSITSSNANPITFGSALSTSSSMTATTFNGNLTGNVTGATTGAHNGTVGATTPAAGNFTDGDFSGNLVVDGNLTVTGTTTTINTETLTVDDNIIVLNNNATGSATQDAGIEIERGDDANKQFIWDETNDRWSFGAENVYTTGEFQGTATSAQYADLAERYHSGMAIEAGSVVCFGGDHEIKACDEEGCTAVAGVISTAPAYLMNNEAEGVALALAGRVPCKVKGGVKAGDLLMSAGDGMATKASDPKPGTIIGKALHDADEDGVIEILAMMM
jgi:hypothetical protein